MQAENREPRHRLECECDACLEYWMEELKRPTGLGGYRRLQREIMQLADAALNENAHALRSRIRDLASKAGLAPCKNCGKHAPLADGECPACRH